MSTNQLRGPLLAATRAFRVGRTAEGHAELIEFIDLLDQALKELQNARVAKQVLPHIQEIIRAQERGDILRIADLLEYELQPML